MTHNHQYRPKLTAKQLLLSYNFHAQLKIDIEYFTVPKLETSFDSKADVGLTEKIPREYFTAPEVSFDPKAYVRNVTFVMFVTTKVPSAPR